MPVVDPPVLGVPLPPDPSRPIGGKENLTYPRSYVLGVIRAYSLAYAVPFYITAATSYKESSFDPYALGDYQGGVPTSFGLFMLHKGGELPANKDQFWAESPSNNCMIAIPHIASVYHRHPHWSAGQIAAQAQRPADPEAYAHDVDGFARTIQTKGIKGLSSPASFHPHNQPSPPSNTDQGEAIPQGITGGAFTGASDWLLSHLGLPNLGVMLRVIGGGIAVILGLLILFHPSVSVEQVGKAAALL